MTPHETAAALYAEITIEAGRQADPRLRAALLTLASQVKQSLRWRAGERTPLFSQVLRPDGMFVDEIDGIQQKRPIPWPDFAEAYMDQVEVDWVEDLAQVWFE